MAKKTAPLLPKVSHILSAFGERLKLARHRRKLTAKQVAQRAGMTPMTLRSLEAGSPGVTIGAYMAVMHVLGLEDDIHSLAADDPIGRQLQDARLLPRTTTHAPNLPFPTSDPTVLPIAPENAEFAEKQEFGFKDMVSTDDLLKVLDLDEPDGDE